VLVCFRERKKNFCPQMDRSHQPHACGRGRLWRTSSPFLFNVAPRTPQVKRPPARFKHQEFPHGDKRRWVAVLSCRRGRGCLVKTKKLLTAARCNQKPLAFPQFGWPRPPGEFHRRLSFYRRLSSRAVRSRRW
jgi:hypothetical protein